MIRVYTGKGKGKTTSALGAALLAYSEGKKVMVVQFLKGSTYMGEIQGLHRLGIPLIQFGVGCRWSAMIRTGLRHCTGCGECFRQNRNLEIIVPLIEQGVEFLKEKTQDREIDLIILDEVSHALKHGFLKIDTLNELIDHSHENLDWIFTGRDMTEELMPKVDLWYELNPEKHPFEVGIRSRRGIEY